MSSLWPAQKQKGEERQKKWKSIIFSSKRRNCCILRCFYVVECKKLALKMTLGEEPNQRKTGAFNEIRPCGDYKPAPSPRIIPCGAYLLDTEIKLSAKSKPSRLCFVVPAPRLCGVKNPLAHPNPPSAFRNEAHSRSRTQSSATSCSPTQKTTSQR
jgi:hypothetical protein